MKMKSGRSYQPELMDDLTYQGEDLEVTLNELDFINRWLGGEDISIQGLKKLNQSDEIRTFADLGCGSGSILEKIKSKFPSISCTGIDANPHIVGYAKQMHPDIRFECQNIFDTAFNSKQYDVIHCCLFLHHFTDDELISLFKQLKKQARIGIIVNDLHRHPFAYWSIYVLTSLFSRSKLVRHDARLSVSRGFRRNELVRVMKQAGVTRYDLNWKWAFRWQLIIYTGD